MYVQEKIKKIRWRGPKLQGRTDRQTIFEPSLLVHFEDLRICIFFGYRQLEKPRIAKLIYFHPEFTIDLLSNFLALESFSSRECKSFWTSKLWFSWSTLENCKRAEFFILHKAEKGFIQNCRIAICQSEFGGADEKCRSVLWWLKTFLIEILKTKIDWKTQNRFSVCHGNLARKRCIFQYSTSVLGFISKARNLSLGLVLVLDSKLFSVSVQFLEKNRSMYFMETSFWL